MTSLRAGCSPPSCCCCTSVTPCCPVCMSSPSDRVERTKQVLCQGMPSFLCSLPHSLAPSLHTALSLSLSLLPRSACEESLRFTGAGGTEGAEPGQWSSVGLGLKTEPSQAAIPFGREGCSACSACCLGRDGCSLSVELNFKTEVTCVVCAAPRRPAPS